MDLARRSAWRFVMYSRADNVHYFMINLLPQSEKKELLREYWMRFGIIVLCLFLALEVLGMVLFVPAYYALYLNTRDLAQSLMELRALTPEGAKEAQQSLAAIKKEITLLKLSDGIIDVPPSVLLDEIALQKPQGIELSAFSYVRTANTASIQLSGTARTQEDLLAFRRNVKTNPRVLDFKYASNFITQKTDINFSATVTFK